MKPCLTLPEIAEILTRAGIRPTAQRLALSQYILCQADHPTAEAVMAWATENFPKISLATVYNTLNTLVSAGLVREYKFPHLDKAIYDNNCSPHYHFLDKATGHLLDLPLEAVTLRLHSPERYQIDDTQLVFHGTLKGA